MTLIRSQFLLVLTVVGLLSLPSHSCATGNRCEFVRDPAAAASPIPDGFGVNIHFTDPKPGEIKMIAAGGFRWVRMDLKWDLTEPEKGKYDFTAYDRLVAELDKFGLRALFILDYTNPFYENGKPPRSDTARNAFANWAVAAAKHFGGRQIIWEVYNEPNNPTFWPPQSNVGEYAALALAVGRAFRAAVPQEKLIGPAVGELDFQFLEGCFKAGLLEYWSAVSVHPYLREDPERVAKEYCRLREMIKTYAPSKSIPIISSEWGYSAAWPGMTVERQGQLLARQWLVNVANNIPLSIWYDWSDDGSDANDPEHHFGTVSNSYHAGRELVYDPKPAYLAAKTLSSFFAGYQFEERLNLGGAEDYVLVFRKDNERRFAVWTTSDQSHQVVLPLKAGRVQITTHTGATNHAVADREGLRITITQAPLYIEE